ncbi:MAG: tetratricopeptide repeat-containing serine/threonine-protein kinase [marine benthic group bacterium]|jgi:serine/threonine-protein kinase|nr:tetratricopeptide repeat-containing serine/threonine-protein kinase [Gemmatimonadota bacterium]MCL7974397.1 tetratricopeptide repeat-containing serine/threonine-protein kinase [Gemmatimonadota bacterium]MCL7977669.1 tetratricopeptide repeat-containing serine/threonine-protein kinase [Gemmatimonadota bacterium]
MDARDRLNEALSDRYRLEEEIGRGGMAVVYRARDLRHGRDVAFKVLLPEIAAAVGPERFLREVELAARLTHPTILPVFDSGQVDELLYYVMPFINGETLADRIERIGPLPLEESLRIAREVADGLAYAHSEGIVHRDMKPGNVLLAGDHAWIADFGIALPVGPEAETHLTRTGLAIGTPSYMSPEQAAGERNIDGRSDLFSLGCVLYEMLSGELPFQGPTPQSILVRRLTEDPTPIRSLRKEVPPGVERALRLAMARDPDSRYETAADFRDALAAESGTGQRLASVGRGLAHRARVLLKPHPILVPIVAMILVGAVAAIFWVLGSGSAPSLPGIVSPGASEESTSVSVAVLLPRTPGSDAGLDGYGEALTDELIHRLGAIEGVETRSLRAVLPYEESATPPDSIGRALSVDYLVESTLLGTTDSLRFNLALVEAQSGTVLDESRYEAATGQILQLVDSVTNEVAFSLRQRLGGEFRVRELQSQTDDEAAWLLVSEAETDRRRAVEAAGLGDENRDRAVLLIEHSDSLILAAAQRDSSWAEPYIQAGLNRIESALIEGDEARSFGPEDRPAIEAAAAFADEALSRDSMNSAALALRGRALHALAGLAEDENARELLDRDATAWLERAIAVDPDQVDALIELAKHARFHEGNSERALELLERAYAADRWLADAATLVSSIAEVATDVERYELAWERTQEGRKRWPDNFEFLSLQLLILASNGTDVVAARAISDTLADMFSLDRDADYRLLMEIQIAGVLARAGMADSARAILERAESRTGDADLRDWLAYDLAHSWLVYGDTSRALDWLQVDLEAAPDSRALRATEPWFRPLHGNPRFETLVSAP